MRMICNRNQTKIQEGSRSRYQYLLEDEYLWYYARGDNIIRINIKLFKEVQNAIIPTSKYCQDCHLSRIPLRLYSYSTYESKLVGSILCNHLDIYYFLEQTPTDHTLVTLQAAQRAQARAPKKNDANSTPRFGGLGSS